MEAVQWVYQKCLSVGLAVKVGRMEGAPENKGYIYETSHASTSTKDGPYANEPTVTISLIRSKQIDLYTAYDLILPVIVADVANGITRAFVVDRELYEHEKQELYRMDIIVSVKQQ